MKNSLIDELLSLDDFIKRKNPFQKRIYYMNRKTFNKMVREHQAIEIQISDEKLIFEFMGCECHISGLVEDNYILFKTEDIQIEVNSGGPAKKSRIC